MGARVRLRALIGGAHVVVITIAVLFTAAFTRDATKSVVAMAGHTLIVRRATLPIAALWRTGLKTRAVETVLATRIVLARRTARVGCGALVPAGTFLHGATQCAEAFAVAALTRGNEPTFIALGLLTQGALRRKDRIATTGRTAREHTGIAAHTRGFFPPRLAGARETVLGCNICLAIARTRYALGDVVDRLTDVLIIALVGCARVAIIAVTGFAATARAPAATITTATMSAHTLFAPIACLAIGAFGRTVPIGAVHRGLTVSVDGARGPATLDVETHKAARAGTAVATECAAPRPITDLRSRVEKVKAVRPGTGRPNRQWRRDAPRGAA